MAQDKSRSTSQTGGEISVESSQDTLFRADNVSVRFGGVTALNDVSLTVAAKQIHALIGPNGAGKTTFFNAVSGLVRVQEGSFTLLEEPLPRGSQHAIARSGVGRTFQNLSLFDDLDVESNLLLGRHLESSRAWIPAALGIPQMRSDRKRQAGIVREVAQMVGVDQILSRPTGGIAYGDRKRVEFARALCMEPQIILLDEPVAGMNASDTQQMARTLLRVRDSTNVGIILVEHDMGMVMEVADWVTVLDFGSVIASGTPQEIQRHPAVLEAYLGTKS